MLSLQCLCWRFPGGLDREQDLENYHSWTRWNVWDKSLYDIRSRKRNQVQIFLLKARLPVLNECLVLADSVGQVYSAR